MPLELDARQRAMLQEMGVRVWLPGAAFEPPAAATTRPAADTTVRAPTRSSLESPAPQAPPAPMPGAAPVAQAALTAATELDAMDGASLQQAATLCKACGLCGGRQGLGLVEEHILLLGAACFALGGEDLAHHLVEPLLEQVTLDAKKSVLSNQDIPLRKCCLQVLLQASEFFDRGLQSHCVF